MVNFVSIAGMHPVTYLRRILLFVLAIGQKLDEALCLLRAIRALLVKNSPAASRIEFDVVRAGDVNEGAKNVQIRDNQKFTASLAPVDSKGQPAVIQAGSVVWTGPANLGLTPSDDGLSCVIVANGLGMGDVTASADADLGQGVRTIAAIAPHASPISPPVTKMPPSQLRPAKKT